jgi:hypothetical protein
MLGIEKARVDELDSAMGKKNREYIEKEVLTERL